MNNHIILNPVASVKNTRQAKIDDNWGEIISEIELAPNIPIESLDGIESFSHLEIIFYFDKATKTITGSEHPRENPNWPKVGIFAQRKKDRPNHLGLTIVKLLGKHGKTLTVSYLDAIDGTPVLDIKPVFEAYLPVGKIKEPEWSKELIRNYWNKE